MAETEIEMKILERLYYDPANEVGYAGARNLTRSVSRKKGKKIPRATVLEWLASQDAYTLHKSIRRKFSRARYNVQNIDDLWEADLVDLRSIKQYNDGYGYLLVIIDVLSKFAWVEPLADKSAATVAGAFERVLSSTERCPVQLQTDKGKEFVGAQFQKLLAARGVRYRVTRNPDIKAAVVERFNRTLKERMWRYFTHKNTHRYLDVLRQLVEGYNATTHSTIKMAPSMVTLENAAAARFNMEKARGGPPRSGAKPRFRVGERVRISKAKGAFKKGYEANWTEEVFEIRRVLHRAPIVYLLEDLEGEEIDGLFYEAELQRVVKDDVMTVDKIIRTRGKGASKKLFVSWRGYPEKFNSWIAASSVRKQT